MSRTGRYSEKIEKVINTLCPVFRHARKRVEHARQLKEDYNKILKEITDHLDLDPKHVHIDDSLEHYLELEHDKTVSELEVKQRIYLSLPLLQKGFADCFSFSRPKDPQRLANKIKTKERNTDDTWGMQLWIADPELMKYLVKLENPQHPLRKKWEDKGIEVTFNNHCHTPKSHGYRSFHINFRCPGNNGWTENLEMQISPEPMMVPYLVTRGPYETYRNIVEYLRDKKGENEHNWTNKEQNLVHTLIDYIYAEFEKGAHKAQIIDMEDSFHEHKHKYANADQADEKVKELRPTVEKIINKMLEYDNNVKMFLENLDDFFGEQQPEEGQESKLELLA
ncbi:MAG: hypothetical protein OEY94_04815 [Alphaproteobacteria bacterium]|nr:hypothetical protein [Alphaproteobacteria bacterium]